MAKPATLSGGCFCGAVRYKDADAFTYALNCHCSQCRRTTGSAFKLIVGDETGHDAHCKRCGSLLYSIVRDSAYAHVAMGTLIDAPSISPTAHIFVGSKAPWFKITDKPPQYKGHVTAKRR